MSIVFLPQPHNVVIGKGTFSIPRAGTIGISSRELYPLAMEARRVVCGWEIATTAAGVADTLAIRLAGGGKPGGYRLRITPAGIELDADSVAAARCGLATLAQLARQCPGGKLPAMIVDDWPDFEARGVYYDVSRGRVPKIERLEEMVEDLARYKINQLQLYIEHTFRFRNHPDIGKGADPLTAEDILRLDAVCARRGVELVPSLASFGHMEKVLCHKRYHVLAEDWGVGRYVSPEAMPGWHPGPSWSLSPGNPKTYQFLDSLFAEFLPCFSSDKFNVCCDETWDIGLGQSYELCKQIGKARLYLGHIIRLNELCHKYGKRMMFWGDIVRQSPEFIAEIPKDVIVLDWGYAHDHNFAAISDFKRAGLDFYACPSTNGHCSLFPQLPVGKANISGFAAAGRANGAKGLLNTDWGDGGHFNFMEFSWHGYLMGAEQAWNVGADIGDFTERFCKLELNIDSPAVAAAVDEFGDVSSLTVKGFYQSVWKHVYFGCAGDAVFDGAQRPAWCFIKGKLSQEPVRLDAALGRRTMKRLAAVRKGIAAAAARKGADPRKLLPYWLFAVDTTIHAARRLTVLTPGGKDTPAARKALAAEMRSLEKRFKKLWLARNRKSEIDITLGQYRKAMGSLGL